MKKIRNDGSQSVQLSGDDDGRSECNVGLQRKRLSIILVVAVYRMT